MVAGLLDEWMTKAKLLPASGALRHYSALILETRVPQVTAAWHAANLRSAVELMRHHDEGSVTALSLAGLSLGGCQLARKHAAYAIAFRAFKARLAAVSAREGERDGLQPEVAAGAERAAGADGDGLRAEPVVLGGAAGEDRGRAA